MRTSWLGRLQVAFTASILSAAALGTAWGQASAPDVVSSDLATKIAAMVAEPAVSRTHWGIMVTSMDGAPIYALNEGQLFQPASNTKLFTTAAALALLKSDSYFKTQIFAESAPAEGILEGNLVIQGDGDASISGRTIPYAARTATKNAQPPLQILDEMVDQIAATGLKKIEGNIVGDDTLFPWEPYAPDWAADDLLWGYGAPVSALTINDNQLRLTISPGKLPPGRAAHQVDGPVPPSIYIDPGTPFYTLENDAITTEPKSKTFLGIDRALGSRTLRIYGTVAEDAASEVDEIAIDDPAEYAAEGLKQRLEARGISVIGRAIARHQLPTTTAGFLEQARTPIAALGNGSQGTIAPCLRCNVTQKLPDEVLLASHNSPSVGEDVVITNKESQNLHAELLLHQLGVAFGNDGSTAQGARIVRQFLVNAGIDPADFVFFDGSGLSGHDLVNPRAIAKLLQFAATQPWFATYKSSLPIGGVDGSLESRFTKAPLKGHVFAKTGTNSETRALSGYLECANGRTVIFSILAGDHFPSTIVDREVIDRIVAAIAAAN